MKKIVFVSLVLMTFIFGCKKKETTTSDPAPTTTGSTTGTNPTTSLTINSGAQALFSLDGASLSYVESLTAPVVANGQSNVVSLPTLTVGTTFFNSTGTVIKISKGTFTEMTGTGTSVDTQFDNFFPKTTHPYSVGSTNGITVDWYDASGTKWSTDNGSQTGSVFTIVDKAQDYIRDSNGFLMMKVYATFNCKVYNTSGGVKTITNGKFVGYYSYN